ncbi:DUF5985 family protein [Sphingomonas quercus]|uniref:GGDEF domain-containing protein n=1 Tax=Sphingomonas quercus TaxID=2842451 RepID=A0ABS6BJF6_9SPHN|nr:DUF5985 family protein [Sphingomonas quercus]MBU3077571.1 hypothetical protein [Sphingomonas quercus]
MGDLLPAIVYVLCFVTSTACAWLLGKTWRRSRAPLLFWSALCFGLLAANNLVLILDMLIFPAVDLRLARSILSLGAVSVLLFGFIWSQGEEA